VIKAVRKVGMKGMYLNIVNGIYYKSMVNIILHSENLKKFPLNSGTDKGTHSSLSYSA
jgi:hypothetical protein